MKKINEGYTSLFDYLVEIGFPFARTINKTFYSQKIPYDNQMMRERYQLIGAFQPIASIANDIEYTIKPYKSLRDAFVDFIQPIRGLGNILRGLAILAVLPIFLVVSSVVTLFSKHRYMKDNLRLGLSWAIDGVCSIIRGLAQIVVTPLTWLLKMPLRGILTAIKGRPDIIENEEIQNIIAYGNTIRDTNTMMNIGNRLHQTYEKACSKGEKTSSIEKDEEIQAFKRLNEKKGSLEFKAYLSIYKSPDQLEKEEFIENLDDDNQFEIR